METWDEGASSIGFWWHCFSWLPNVPFPLGPHRSETVRGLWSIPLLRCCCSVTQFWQLFATPRTASCQASLSFTISCNLLRLMSIESVMPPNHLILCHPRLLFPSIFSSIGVFSNKSALPIRWPKYWSFSYTTSPSNEYSGLISFRIDWFDLFAVPGTLKSLLQHHSLNVSFLQLSAFLMIQISHPFMTTGKTIAFTIWTFVSKVTSLLFNTLCLGLSWFFFQGASFL